MNPLRLLALMCVTSSLTCSVLADTRVPLKPVMVINESALGDASHLVDEQEAIGDPGNGKGIRPTSPFFPGWTAWQYPLHVVIDLGSLMHLTKVCLFNETGESQIELSTGAPGAWLKHPVLLNGYREWKTFPITDAPSRYLRITLLKPTSLPELALYAEKLPQVQISPKALPPSHARPTIDRFIGTNAFIDDPIDLLTASVGFIREYHNWSWDTEGKDGLVRFQPSGAAGGNLWFFDDYYKKLAAATEVCPCLQNSSPVHFKGEPDFKPVAPGDDPEQPASYRIHAAHMFQYAARYGTKTVPNASVHIAPDQPVRTGLGLIHYFEDWNEPDKTWKGREGRFAPFELAAMCSADRDGHMGKLGTGYGIRSADPNAKLVLGGLAGIGIDYLDGMKLWADAFRGGQFPADVINVHHYSNDGTPEQPFRKTGISPEDDHLRQKMAEIVAWRDRNAPFAEVWLSEFGYDTNAGSPFHSPAIGSMSAETVQAVWLVRSYLALASAGVDRAAMFMFRDVKSTGAGVFETSGLVTEKGQWKPKPSYWYVATLKNRLKGMRYDAAIPTGSNEVMAYKFSGGGKTAYVLWRPTSDDGKTPNFKFKITAKSTLRVDFATGKASGVETVLPVQNNEITLTVGEQPIILFEQ